MFETSSIQAHSFVMERRYGTLTLSLALHVIAALALVILAFQAVAFPNNAPRELPVFMPSPQVTLPVQKGRPDVRRPSATVAAVANRSPAQQTAPPAIPNSVTPLPPSGSTDTAGDPSARPGIVGDGPIGDPNGVPHGIPMTSATPLPEPAIPTGPMVVSGDVKAPVAINRIQPRYPQIALNNHIGGTVTVRCIIDKSGRVRDAEVVNTTFGAFNQPAVDAVLQWTFVPGSFHGHAVDTIFELTVNYAPR